MARNQAENKIICVFFYLKLHFLIELNKQYIVEIIYEIIVMMKEIVYLATLKNKKYNKQ